MEFSDVAIGEEFVWDHLRQGLMHGWCIGAPHGVFQKVSTTTYCKPKDNRIQSIGASPCASDSPVFLLKHSSCTPRDYCAGVYLCLICNAPLWQMVVAPEDHREQKCKACIKATSPVPAKPGEKFTVTLVSTVTTSDFRRELRSWLHGLATVVAVEPDLSWGEMLQKQAKENV